MCSRYSVYTSDRSIKQPHMKEEEWQVHTCSILLTNACLYAYVCAVNEYACVCVCVCMFVCIHVIGRICSTFERFKDRHYKLTEKLIKQGFWYTGLCMAFKRFVRSHANIFHKYKCIVLKNTLRKEFVCQPMMFSRVITYVEDSPVTSWFCGFVCVVYIPQALYKLL